MNRKITTITTLGCVLALGTFTSAYAQQTTPNLAYNQHQGVYIGGNLGLAAAVGNGGAGLAGFAASINGGYQFNPHFAVETGAAAMSTVLGDFYSFHLALKGILPIGDRFSIFGKAGGAVIVYDQNLFNIPGSTITTGGPYLGAGIGFAISHSLETTFQYNGVILTNNNITGFLGQLTLGLTYHFQA